MKYLSICFFWFIFRAAYQNELLKDSVQSTANPKPILQVKEEFNLAKCDPQVLTQFISKPALKTFITNDPSVSRVCPDMKDSCCSGEELSQFSDILQKKGNTLDKFAYDMGKLIDLIVAMGEPGLKKLSNIAAVNKCLPTEESTLEQAYKYIFVYSEKILRDTHTAINFSRSRTSSLICEICTTRAVNFLNIKPKETHLIVHNDYCKRFYTTTEGMMYFRIFHHLSYFEPFITTISCLFKQKMKLNPFFGEQNWKLQMDNYIYCMKAYDKKKIVDLENCIFQCKTFNPLNDNIFREISPSISSIVPLFNDFIGSPEYAQCPTSLSKKSITAIHNTECIFSTKISLESSEELKDIEVFNYYITGIIKDKKNSFFKVDWLISSKDGLNPDKNQFSYFESKHLFALQFIVYFIFILID
jgi:hypothetical protein